MRYEGIDSGISFKPKLPDYDRLVAHFDAVIVSMPLLMLVCCTSLYFFGSSVCLMSQYNTRCMKKKESTADLVRNFRIVRMYVL